MRSMVVKALNLSQRKSRGERRGALSIIAGDLCGGGRKLPGPSRPYYTVASENRLPPKHTLLKSRPRFLALALTNGLTELSQAHTGV